MNIYLAFLIVFSSTFLLVYLGYKLSFKRKKTKDKDIMEVKLLRNKFNINMRVIKYKKLLNMIAFINSFILAFTFTLVCMIDSYILSLCIGFVLLLGLTYSMYELLGRHLEKKGGK